ncbi:hypothetical protein CEXT_621221 [Caerostris extrusa]|uniref:Uncharacterized protein n=1 Tax=Caerostris extrusa TaxID=172846 RepID=A0AAV4WIP6_CAEEX|nr:hypothetical protein CEXT_621221 [Caerostris extrusa]
MYDMKRRTLNDIQQSHQDQIRNRVRSCVNSRAHGGETDICHTWLMVSIWVSQNPKHKTHQHQLIYLFVAQAMKVVFSTCAMPGHKS